MFALKSCGRTLSKGIRSVGRQEQVALARLPQTLRASFSVAAEVLVGKNANTISSASNSTAVDLSGKDFPTVDILWKDGHKSTFHAIWLLDHDPKYVHETSLQRGLDSAGLSLSTEHPTAIAVSDDGSKVTFSWEGAEVVEYDAEFLRNHCYTKTPPEEFSSPKEFDPILWNAKNMSKDTIPTFNSERIVSDDAELYKALVSLKKYGVILVDNMPSSLSGTEEITRRFGPPRETFYGAMWDTAPKPGAEVNDTAYTKDALHPHTDASYLYDMAGLQCFNCVAQSEALTDEANSEEGCTKILDGFKIMEILKQEEPSTYEFFLNNKLKWFCMEEGVHMEMVATAFTETPYKIFRYNSYDLDTVDYLPSELVPEYYKHTKIINEYIRSKDNVVLARLMPGEMVIVDNQRVCHGRTSFTGYRNMVGCYIGRDDWYSKLRVLKSQVDLAE
mmetsp:Transcript_14900/g.17410  ORF Transcript_14900/g.17410 Transcript_14900/m.17410 type:complete len:446 (+) Transcript_14900:348-1685(+)